MIFGPGKECVIAKYLPARELDASVVVAMPTSRICIDFVRNESVPLDSTLTSKTYFRCPARGRPSDIDESQER